MNNKENITLEDLFAYLESEANYIKRELDYIKKDPTSKYNHSKDFIDGYKVATYSLFKQLRERFEYPEIRSASDEEKKEFTRNIKFTASALDVGINSLYGMKLEEGKEYETKEIPFGIMEYRGEKIPVYSDDPGQQDYCIYNGKTISGGAYNLFPEEVFVSEIDFDKFNKIIENEELEEE